MSRSACLFVAMIVGLQVSKSSADDPPKSPAKAKPTIEARFTDGSTMKLTLRDEAIEIQSPYGRLRVPTNEIRRVELATRIPPELAERIAVLITDLGDKQFPVRETASTELAKLRERPYHALLAALKLKDLETVKRANELVEAIRAESPEEQLDYRPHDVIYTAHSKIAGRIEAAILRAETTQFGEVPLKLTDLRNLRIGAENDAQARNVLPDPGSLHQYQARLGETLSFRVTGVTTGSIWGTKVYTFDSPLATTAVHAGVLKAGQTGVVRVKLMPSPQSYTGSTQNGVSSGAYGMYGVAYEFIRKSGDD